MSFRLNLIKIIGQVGDYGGKQGCVKCEAGPRKLLAGNKV
jgi:hypothetical protein